MVFWYTWLRLASSPSVCLLSSSPAEPSVSLQQCET